MNRWLDVSFNDDVSKPVDMSLKALSHAGVKADYVTINLITKLCERKYTSKYNNYIHIYDMKEYVITNNWLSYLLFIVKMKFSIDT